jgi:hypothetical protein
MPDWQGESRLTLSQYDFFLLTSFGRDNAVRRVGSDPVFDGLDQLGIPAGRCVVSDHVPALVPDCRYLVIHAYDKVVFDLARTTKQRTGCEVICLTSDLYDIDWFTNSTSIVDYFVAPTSHHLQILSSAVWRPVFEVPEGIDAIAYPLDGRVQPVEENNRLVWFGYPESFTKSLRCLLPQALHESRTSVQDLRILTAAGQDLLSGAEHVPFEVSTFYQTVAKCGYALLSHFVFDSHINSFIKSPNKFITALVRGCVPLASDTPNYRDLAAHYGLEKFTYRTGQDLVRILSHRNIAHDRSVLPFDQIRADLEVRFSPKAIATTFASHFVG